MIDRKTPTDVENGLKDGSKKKMSTWGVFFKIFSMVFFAEWGDRSQVSMIDLTLC